MKQHAYLLVVMCVLLRVTALLQCSGSRENIAGDRTPEEGVGV